MLGLDNSGRGQEVTIPPSLPLNPSNLLNPRDIGGDSNYHYSAETDLNLFQAINNVYERKQQFIAKPFTMDMEKYLSTTVITAIQQLQLITQMKTSTQALRM